MTSAQIEANIRFMKRGGPGYSPGGYWVRLGDGPILGYVLRARNEGGSTNWFAYRRGDRVNSHLGSQTRIDAARALVRAAEGEAR